MFGSLSEEVEVKVAADIAWQLYGTIKLGEIAAKHTLKRMEVIEGDGGVGTIIKVTFKPDLDEFDGLYRTIMDSLENEEDMMDAFNVFDQNLDGFIMIEELKSVLESLELK